MGRNTANPLPEPLSAGQIHFQKWAKTGQMARNLTKIVRKLLKNLQTSPGFPTFLVKNFENGQIFFQKWAENQSVFTQPFYL